MKRLLFLFAYFIYALFGPVCRAEIKTAIQWQKTIGGTDNDNSTCIEQTPDGGYIVGGFSASDSSGEKSSNSKGGIDYWVLKLNAQGNIEWQKTLGGSGDDFLRTINRVSDGYLLAGYSSSGISGDKNDSSRGGLDYWIIKVDLSGNIQWQKTYGGAADDMLFSVCVTPDNGFLLGGYSLSDSSGDKTAHTRGAEDLWIVKLNSAGTIEWQKTIGGNQEDKVREVQPVFGGGYILIGTTKSGISGEQAEATNGGLDWWIVRINDTGNIVWQNTIGASADDYLISGDQTSDKGFILAGDSYSPASGDKSETSFNADADFWVVKVDSLGQIKWETTIGGDLWDAIYNVRQTTDGGYILAGNSVSNASLDKTEINIGGNGTGDFWIMKLDGNGNIVWQNTIGGNVQDDVETVRQTLDGGFILSGYSSSTASNDKAETTRGGYDYWIVKLIADPRFINGNIFADLNNNCTKNGNDHNLPHYTLSATSTTNALSFNSSDSLGNYSLAVGDTGNYTLELQPNVSYPLFSPATCNNYAVHLADTLATRNLSLQPSLLCSNNTVSVSVGSRFRRCIPNIYTVAYSNNGSAISPNTYIDISLDRLLTFNTASIPVTALGDNVYRFSIGALDYLRSGSFYFTATPRCDSTINGQTLCVEAHIYPDTVCTLPDYTGSHIVAAAECLGDSIRLKITNIGGAMIQSKKYIVIEGNVMRIRQNFQLPHNGTITRTFAADSGHTFRIIAEQEDGFPRTLGSNHATAAIEGCRTASVSNFQTGYFTQFSNYDGEPYRSVSCNVIVASYDPNDKVASPVGYEMPHYVEFNTDINYQIDFQNTGNDTAFKVVIIDTITPYLDIQSVQLGASSHAYSFEQTDSNVLKFTFDPILLPDSTTNENASHGFVQFTISQKDSLPLGTVIHNNADIYFDYNAPVRTNTTYHTIGKDFILVDLLPDIIINPKYEVSSVKIMPNPFRDRAMLVVESLPLKNPVLWMMNVKGEVIKKITAQHPNSFEILREDLSGGIYFYKIMQDDDVVASGKMIIQ